MSLLSSRSGSGPKIELKSKECIDSVLQPLKDYITIKINGSLTCEDIFRTVENMAVNKTSVHSVSKQYENVARETSIRYHLKKSDIEELIQSNEKILLQDPKILKTSKSYEFAVDFTNDPYYGKTDSSCEKYVYVDRLRSQKFFLLLHLPLHQ